MKNIMLQQVSEGLAREIGSRLDLDYSQGQKQLLVSIEGIFSLKPREAIEILNGMRREKYLVYYGEKESELEPNEGLVEAFQTIGPLAGLKSPGYWLIGKDA